MADRQTDRVTPWAPVGAKKQINKNICHLFLANLIWSLWVEVTENVKKMRATLGVIVLMKCFTWGKVAKIPGMWTQMSHWAFAQMSLKSSWATERVHRSSLKRWSGMGSSGTGPTCSSGSWQSSTEKESDAKHPAVRLIMKSSGKAQSVKTSKLTFDLLGGQSNIF